MEGKIWKGSGVEIFKSDVLLDSYGHFHGNGKWPQNGWFIMENPIKMDDLGGPPLFLETPKCSQSVFVQ